MSTTIQISDELWEKLNKMKKKGETFLDVLLREIEEDENQEKKE